MCPPLLVGECAMSHLKCSDVAPHKYGEEHPGGSSSEAHCCWGGFGGTVHVATSEVKV